MVMAFVRLSVTGLVLAAMYGCNGGEGGAGASSASGGGRWVASTYMCPDADYEEMQADAAMRQVLGNSACGDAGTTFAGEARCQNGMVEFKCN